MREKWNNPEYRQHMSQISKERWEDPIYRDKQLEIMKERWLDPEYRKKQYLKCLFTKASTYSIITLI
ncbi:MAG: hypothetical protein ACTSYF_12050 [Promethearchaeota archaeon]